MKFDVILVGAGPAGYFAAYELTKLNPDLKVALIDGGNPIEKRHCPVLEHKLQKCPLNAKGYSECYPSCSITSGFGGAGAYSDGKFNITTEFGGWLTDYMDEDELLEVINYIDGINMQFGATDVITDPYSEKVKQIERRAMASGLKLLRSRVRHLGTEENLKILTKISDYLKERVEMRFGIKAKDVIVEDGKAKGVILENGEVLEADFVSLSVVTSVFYPSQDCVVPVRHYLYKRFFAPLTGEILPRETENGIGLIPFHSLESEIEIRLVIPPDCFFIDLDL